MSEPLMASTDAGLRQLLQDPVAAPVRRRRWDGAAFRIALGAAQVAQVTLLGLLTRLVLAPGSAPSHWHALGLVGLVAALAALLRRDFGRAEHDRGRIARAAAVAVLTAAGALAAVLLLAVPQPADQRDDLLRWLLAWAGLSAAVAAALELGAARLQARLRLGERILLFGAPERTERVARLLAAAPDARWQLAGRVDGDEAALLRRIEQLAGMRRLDTVLLLLDVVEDATRIDRLLGRLADQRIRVCLALDLPVRGGGPVPLVELAAPRQSGWPAVLKRGIDVGLSLVLLVGLAPVMGLAALAVMLESPGPALFRQWRFGAGSRPFQVLKFRTMRAAEGDPTGARRTARADPRVTRIGRFLRRSSIDELPQLINVLRGEMALVGPRPHPLHMRVGDAYYFEVVERYRARHAVRPGLTGWAQVNGARGEVDSLAKALRRVELDLWYIEHWSLLLDLRIILRTALGGFASPTAD